MLTKTEKYRNAARILAAEGWAKFKRGKVKANLKARGHKRGQPHQPYACERADVFVKAMYPPGASQPAYDANPALRGINIETPTEVVLDVAYHTHCNCHPNITRAELFEMMFDAT